jgi:hypothetical protein
MDSDLTKRPRHSSPSLLFSINTPFLHTTPQHHSHGNSTQHASEAGFVFNHPSIPNNFAFNKDGSDVTMSPRRTPFSGECSSGACAASAPSSNSSSAFSSAPSPTASNNNGSISFSFSYKPPAK